MKGVFDFLKNVVIHWLTFSEIYNFLNISYQKRKNMIYLTFPTIYRKNKIVRGINFMWNFITTLYKLNVNKIYSVSYHFYSSLIK